MYRNGRGVQGRKGMRINEELKKNVIGEDGKINRNGREWWRIMERGGEGTRSGRTRNRYLCGGLILRVQLARKTYPS